MPNIIISKKPFFYASLFFAVLLLITVVIKLVFAWNPPTTIAPNPAGQTLYSDSSNNIGIGTLYPGAKLEVYSTSSDSILKLSRQSATSTLFKLGTDSALIINNNSLDVLTIKNGNVGIGTTAPAYKLEIVESSLGTKNQIFLAQNNGAGGIHGWKMGSSGTSGDFDITRYVSSVVTTKTLTILENGNVGIGTTGPADKLSVNGTIRSLSGGFIFPDGTTQATATSGAIPSGAVMFFNLASCPTSWTALTTAQGRYLVGLPSGGTLAGTIGTALSNLENRAVGLHSHTYTVRPNSNVNIGSGSTNIYIDVPSSSQTNDAGSVAGTNAPYIQFLVCQKD